MPTKSSLTRYWTLSLQQKFLTRFSQLLQNGFSISDALHIMATLFKKQAIQPMIDACSHGQHFADTLEQAHFETRIIYMIRCSEQAGALLQGLQKAADYSDFHLKNRSELSKKIRYPLTLFALISLILVAVFTLFMPKIKGFYQSFNLSNNSSLLQGVILIMISTFILLSILTLLIFCILHVQHLSFQTRVKSLLFRIPLIRPLIQKIFSYYFSSQWLIFLNCGLSLKESLNMMIQFETIPFIRLIIEDLHAQFEAGNSLSNTIQSSSYFTPYFKLTMSHALILGNLTSELNHYSASEFKALSAILNNSFKVIQFSFLLLIGIIIILVYLSILQPVFDMMNLI